MTLTLYAFGIVAAPLLVQSTYFRQEILGALNGATGLHQVPADFVTISLSLVAIYTFVIAGFVTDVADAFSHKYRRAWANLSPGVDYLKQQFPGKALSLSFHCF